MRLKKKYIMKTIKHCKCCGIEMLLYTSEYHKKTFCSKECKYNYSIVKLKCEQCGKEFERSKYEVGRGNFKFCSQECTGLSQRNRKLLKCIECGKKFQIKKSHFNRTQGKYCSVSCMNKNRENKIECICAQCNRKFYRIPSLKFRKNIKFQSVWFCNMSCYMKYHGPTSIELMFENVLSKFNIKFDKQKSILITNCDKIKGLKRITFVDFFIYPNICIYIDGDYWHSLPNVVKKDKMVNDSLPGLGYTVKRFSEKDINMGESRIIELMRLHSIIP